MGKLLDFILSQDDQFRRARLPSLYSDFTPQRSSNPDGFAANIATWRDVLSKAARAGVLPLHSGFTSDTLSLKTGETLLQALETKEWGRPLALSTVIDESVSHHQMMPYQDFVVASKSIHTRNWTVQPWWLLSWGLKQLGILGSITPAGSLPTGQFVIMANVEGAAGNVVTQMANSSNLTGRIFPMKIFREEASRAMDLSGPISESDLVILLTTLARDKGAIVYDDQAVKFKAEGEALGPLSMEDRTIASLKVLIEDLNVQIGNLMRRIDESNTAAQNAIGKKDRPSAMAALKSKKLNQSTLVQRTDMLSQLEGVYHQIEQAHDQVAVIRVMQSSTLVLRNLRTQTGGVEKVEEIVEGLKDEMQQVDEIGSIMEAGGQNDAVDEHAVDEELEQMMQQARAEEQEEETQRTQHRLAEIEGSHTKDTSSTETRQALVEADVEALERLSLEEGPERLEKSSMIGAPQTEAAPGA